MSARMSWSSRVSSSTRGSSGTIPTRNAIAPASPAAAGVAPRLGGRGGEQRAVGVRDLAGAQRGAGVDQLAAGGQDDDPGPGPGEHPLAADGRQQPDLRGAQMRAGVENDRAGRELFAGTA